MGLDMYLTGEKYIWSGEENNELRTSLKEKLKTEFEPESVKLKLMYWRKANAIHKWFVDNVQEGKDDCGHYFVSVEQLEALSNAVNRALESKQPEKILPTQSGFFFGSTEYNEDYTQDLTETKAGLEKLLKSEEIKKLDIYYHSSW